MKKIYILTAVFALLAMSLNAQGFDKKKAKAIDKKEIVDNQKATFMPKSKVPMMSELLRGIKGMSSILPDWNPDGSTMANGQSRAPLMINSDEFTVGPFEGNNFNTNGGIGFGTAYPTNQDVLVTTVLNRDEFVQYNGDQIVGFRFALAGQTSTNNQVKVYDFISWPAGSNGYFETANSHEWNLGAYATTPVTTEYELINDDMTSSNFSTGNITASAPWSATNVNNQTNGSFYIRNGGNLKFTIPSGYNNADFKFSFSTRASYYSGYFTFTPSTGSAVTVNTSEANTVYECELTGLSSGDVVTITGRYSSNTYSPDFTYMHVYAKGGAGTPTSLMLTGGQWYEYYLDEPVDFVVNDTISNLFLGYRYEQYPSSSTNQLCYPIGVNPESTTHNHRALLNVPVSSSGNLVITVPGNTMNLRSITVYDTNNNTLTSWNANTYVNNGSYTAVDIDGDEYYAFNLPSGWTVDYDYLLIYGNSTNGYYGYLQGAGDITIASTALNGNTTVRVEISAFDDNGNVTMSVNNDGKTIGNSLSTYTWNSVNIGTTTYEYGFYPIDFSQYGDLAVQLIMKSSLPKIEVSPETLTISDSGTNNTFTVEGSNLGTDNVGVTPNNGFSTTTDDQNWGFVNNNGSVSGTVTMTYEGRELLTAGTVTAANNLTSATVTVNYVPDLYIYCDNGASPWDFSANPALAMTNQGNGIYTATLANIPANSHILFGRAIGLTYNWEGDNNRLFFGASTDGGDWGYGDNTSGYLDTDAGNDYPVKYHPIYFPEGGSYFISIDANTYIFTITELPAPENVAATANSEDHTATVTWDAPTSLPNGLEPVSYYNVYLDGQLVGSVPANQALTYTFSNLDEGNHTVEISAVYPGGAESELVPAQFNIMARTAMPTISVVDNADGSKTVSATGNGTVHLYVDGVEVTNPYTIMPSSDGDISVTVTATAQEEGKLISETAEQIVTVHEVGRSPQPTITFTDNGDGTYTITVEGTGEIAVYIDDADHAGEPIATVNNTFSFNVEQHSQVMTITVTATNQEGDLEVSRPATETYTIPAMTIDSDFKLLDPQPETSESPIDLSKLMFVDRFSVDIPNDNSHPFMYEYTLEETQVRQRSSNSVDVYAEHTGSNGKGFYTLSQIDNDTTASLVMNVMNAAMDFNLSELSAPFFYTVEREEEADGETYWGWNAVLQRTSVGNYKQTLKYDTKGNLVYNYNDTIFPGEHIQLDLDTITGSYNDYNAYVPVVWTMGFDRVNYNEDDPVHNSYGASVWTTGVAEVTMDTENAPLARVQRGWNTKWSDNNGEKCSLFMLDNVWATATMPTVNTLDYEPYMFRIFVKSKENKLRPYKYVEKDGNTVITAGEGTTNGPICVWNGYINDPDNAHKGVEISYTPGDEDHGMTITFNKNRVIREDANDDWTLSDENAMFGALESIAVSGYDSNGDPVLHDISTDDLEVFVRFYYIVEGIAEGHTPWAPTRDGNGDGEGPAGYGAESDPGGAGVATSVSEVRYHGEVVSKTYYNVQGIKSEQPFSGVNIVVTRYSDGATVVTKVMK